VGVALTSYGLLELWLNTLNSDSAVKQRFCALSMCPDEFSEVRVYNLHQWSAGGYADYSLRQFQRAVLLDSASAYRWADLAEAEVTSKNSEAARYSFQRALTQGPGNPVILFRAANFYFQIGDSQATLRSLNAILRNPELTQYYEPAFLTYSRLGLPVKALLEQGIPRNSTAAPTFLRFWMQGGKVAEAQAAWAWLEKNGSVDNKLVGEYAGFLSRNGLPGEAQETWKRFTSDRRMR
jgi:tetratricopeptide (TPR) repeat protein